MSDEQKAALIDDLTYQSYKANRDRAPHVSVERWGMVYRDVDALEARYQREKDQDQDK